MRDYSKVSPQSSTWIDHNGIEWKEPQILGRLKMRIPCHRALRAFVIARDGQCLKCGAGENLIADHIVSRRNGGRHHPSNLQCLCQPCNSAKAALVDSKGVPRNA